MTFTRRQILAGGSALALVSALQAKLSRRAQAQARTTLHRGNGASPSTLDPHINFGAREAYIQDDMYEGLVANGADGNIIPAAAESWEVSDDGRIFTFRLREGLKWSDGSPVTAQDFVNGILRTLNPATGSEKGYYFTTTVQLKNAQAFIDGTVTDVAEVGAVAPDARTVVLTFDNPAPHAIWVMTSFQTTPLHSPSLEAHGADFMQPGKNISNGAYVMAESVPQSHVTLRKNPMYWDAANVKLEEVVYHVTEDVNAEYKRYLADELDLTIDIPMDRIDDIRNEVSAEEIHFAPNVDVYYFSFNITRKPFDDIRIRKALSMAIDREVLQEKILKSGYPASYSYTPPGVDPTYPQPAVAEKGMAMADRIVEAQRLFAEAGHGPDNPLKLKLVSTSDLDEVKEAQAVAIMWKQALGVEVELVNQEFGAWLDSFYAGDWDVFNDNLVGDFAGAESFLAYMKPSAEAGYNWQNQQYEELMNQAAAIADQGARNKMLAEAEKILLDDYLTAPISGGASRQLIKPRVKGWIDNVVNFHPTRFLWLEG